MSTALRPDSFVIALVIDKHSNMHVKTLVGHYSEFLPNVDLLDNQAKSQIIFETNEYLMILLNNCVNRQVDFRKIYNDYLLRGNLKLNLVQLFRELDYILRLYTMLNEYGKHKYKVVPNVRKEAIKIRYGLKRRSEDFNLQNISVKDHVASVELGPFLRSIVS